MKTAKIWSKYHNDNKRVLQMAQSLVCISEVKYSVLVALFRLKKHSTCSSFTETLLTHSWPWMHFSCILLVSLKDTNIQHCHKNFLQLCFFPESYVHLRLGNKEKIHTDSGPVSKVGGKQHAKTVFGNMLPSSETPYRR